MNVLTSAVRVEDTVCVTMHDRTRELTKRVDARPFPEYLSRYRELRQFRIAPLADRVGKTVSGRIHGFHDCVVKTSVRISEMVDSPAQALFQCLLRFHQL